MYWSKTIQFGERLLQTPLLRLKGSHLCPVTAYDNMLKVVPVVSSDALFLLPNGKPVTYYLFQNKLRNVLNDIGLDSSLYSSHSFRRGFATLAFRNNVSSDEIQILGDWHSDVYKRYISLSIEDKCKIIKDISHIFYV
jgi:integrase